MSETPLNMRITFEKFGKASFISHLELMETLCRALRRAGFKMSLSEGFNRRPYISAARPLSLGYVSKCEMCDTKLLDAVDLVGIPGTLNAVLPKGINVLHAHTPIRSFSEIKFSHYTITMFYQSPVHQFPTARISEFFSSPVNILKRTKSGEKQTDISPDVKKIDAVVIDDKIMLTAVLKDEAGGSLNPSYVTAALCSLVDFPSPEHIVYIRERFLTSDLSVF